MGAIITPGNPGNWQTKNEGSAGNGASYANSQLSKVREALGNFFYLS